MATAPRFLQLASLLDVTRLTDSDSETEFNHWLADLPVLPVTVAAYCVYPQFLTQASHYIANYASKAALATVVNFPSGNQPVDLVLQQIEQALALGAQEIDCVLPYQPLLRGEHGFVKHFLYDIRQACAGKCLKVIIESGELVTAQQIAKASELAIEGGADFVKTSTGKVPVGITMEAAKIILTVIAASDREVGFKASGGVRTLEQALAITELYERVTGKPASAQTMRIGASAILSELVQVINNT